MKQTIRFNTFETNSSSIHSLVIVDKDDFDKFKKGELYLELATEKFVTKEDIMRDNEDFKDYDSFEEFMEDYANGDYPTYLDCYGDCISEEVYDKNGNKKVALSIYIAG